jgi:hypothetical protein
MSKQIWLGLTSVLMHYKSYRPKFRAIRGRTD